MSDERTERLSAELDRARQALWECARFAGADLDGDETWHAMVGGPEAFALDAVKSLREDYDESIQEENTEIMRLRAEVERLRKIETRYNKEHEDDHYDPMG